MNLSRLFPAVLFASMLSICPAVSAGSEVRIWEEDVVLPTYRLDPPDPNPMFYRHEAYQGAQKRIYPYPSQEHVTNIREEKSYRFVFLENEYVRLSVLPELGGRIFSALDKTNDYDFFYRQSVIKPALIGMLGAWISGGVEWCVFHHHRNTTFMPVDYFLAENPDGSKTVWIGETERRHRMHWVIGVTLHPGRSYVETTVKLYNRTPFTHSMLYWANVAVHANEQYQVVFPPTVRIATYHAKTDFIHWPIGDTVYRGVDYRGVDLSWWKNHPEPNSFFAWRLAEDFMGGYDHGRRAGVVHVADHHIVSGAKLWEWGPGPRGRVWDRILTDTDGPYAELMVGAYSDNQPDYSWTAPTETRIFRHYWYPVHDIGGFKRANQDVAVNLEVSDDGVLVGVHPTRPFPNTRVTLYRNGKLWLEESGDLSPARPFVKRLAPDTPPAASDLRLVVSDGDGKTVIEYAPGPESTPPPLPAPVSPPAPPEQIPNNEELYLTGLRLLQLYNPVLDPFEYFSEVLRRDPDDTRTNTIVGIELARQGRYSEAEEHLDRAHRRLSAEYIRPRDMEAAYYLAWVKRELGKTEEAYDLFYQATWDLAWRAAAYQQLAEISSLEGQWDRALAEIERSLAANAENTRARGYRAAFLRRLGRLEEAREEAGCLPAQDPLDFFARNEWTLASSEADRRGRLAELSRLMRDEVESYLELAMDYVRLGMWREASDVLQRPLSREGSFAAGYPMVFYHLAWLSSQMGDERAAESWLQKAAEASPQYCFPFRLESIRVLRWAVGRSPRDARAFHYLGNALFEKQPEAAIQAWETARQLDPAFAATHRNLGWAYYYHRKDTRSAVAAYEEAVARNPQDSRFFQELDQLYELADADPEKRLALLEEHRETVVRRNGSLLRLIRAQIAAGRFLPAVELLESKFFHVQEGAEDIHDLFADAHLLAGLQLFAQGEREAALQHFLRSAEYPENLSVGPPRRDPRLPQIAWYISRGCEALGRDDEAREWLDRAVQGDSPAPGSAADFYRGMALKELGRKNEAEELFASLVEVGERLLKEGSGREFFVSFGERETEAMQKARAHFLRGLGCLGLGKREEAREAFQQAGEYNRGDAWAAYFAGRWTPSPPES
jgi:tetratricopeptide (TPR) repeat protein